MTKSTSEKSGRQPASENQPVAEDQEIPKQIESPADLPSPDDLNELPADFKSGYVGIIGKPNVGKSTLLNALLGERLAIVTHKAQTTRDRILGIHTVPDQAQILFLDTPGVHQPKHSLGEYMVETASGVMEDADILLFLVDVTREPGAEDRQIGELLNELDDRPPVFLILAKRDLAEEPVLSERREAYETLAEFDEVLAVSSTTAENLDTLQELIIRYLPEGPMYYPAEQLTDIQERDIAAELIRKQLLIHLSQEVPHSVAVRVEDFADREDLLYIRAQIYVERESQKGIVIGRNGKRLKQIGRDARKEIQEFFGTQAYLDLWVKVRKNWRKHRRKMKWLGY